MFTRDDYLRNKCTHEQYYAQFINDEVKQLVIAGIGKKRLLNSKDKHFNNIPLAKWDFLMLPSNISSLLVEAGDFMTLAGQVCILKEAGRQIKAEVI